MIDIVRVDPQDKVGVGRFLELGLRLYRDHPLWVPPIRMDARVQLNPQKHPYYEHSEAEFYLAMQDGEAIGRIGLLENKPYNRHHEKRQLGFYLFECIDDFQVAEALFAEALEAAKRRRLDQLIGPKGFGALDGYGMLAEGFEFRPAMTMMNYNPPYYPAYMEKLGFRKEVDFVSHYFNVRKLQLPERVHRIAARAAERSGLHVLRFRSKREMRAWASRIGRAYNQAFIGNWEYYPLSEKEIVFLTDNILAVADPKLMKIIVHEDEAVGFLFGFPDVSAALRRSKGRLSPLGVLDLLREFKRTRWIAINGAGILPEYQGRGGNALLYSEMEKTIRSRGFHHADLTQVAESAVQMRSDLETIGGIPYKNHRVFIREV